MNNPPGKYWQLLELALADFDEIVKDPNYVIDMLFYHDGIVDGNCLVCLAGSVMARTLHADRTKKYCTGEFPDWQLALTSISNMALGGEPLNFPKEHENAFWELQKPLQDKPYNIDPAHWRAHMDKVVQWLKERDL